MHLFYQYQILKGYIQTNHKKAQKYIYINCLSNSGKSLAPLYLLLLRTDWGPVTASSGEHFAAVVELVWNRSYPYSNQYFQYAFSTQVTLETLKINNPLENPSDFANVIPTLLVHTFLKTSIASAVIYKGNV